VGFSWSGPDGPGGGTSPSPDGTIVVPPGTWDLMAHTDDGRLAGGPVRVEAVWGVRCARVTIRLTAAPR
jgi:hypothetical protein